MAEAASEEEGRGEPVENLPDDVLVKILSRVPYKSLCRARCVCRRWRRVISHPDHRALLPRYHLHDTIAGFFHSDDSFTNVTGEEGRHPLVVDPSLPFLPKYEDLELMDSCNGLLLCRFWRLPHPETFDYLVVNPATEQWLVLPESGWSDTIQEVRLGFDPAVSSHFHVFGFVELGAEEIDGHVYEYDAQIKGVDMYSSKTGVWSYRDSGWGDDMFIPIDSKSVFFNGMLHLITMNSVVVAVDVKGNIWRTIPMPQSPDDPYGIGEGFIDLSRGCLHFVNDARNDPYKLSVWVLDDYNGEQWTCKHTVSHLHLFGTERLRFGHDYRVVSIHPERNIIYFVFSRHETLISYEMDSWELHSICELGHISTPPYLPYVPLYSESLANVY